jgi:pimeloyl-ACP methyl ester carboxylesterase
MPATVILVHGAMHTPWVFGPLQDELTARGVVSHAIQLPSSNPNSAATGSLTDDVAAIRSETAKHSAVILVAHSYGGVPATWAATADEVKELIYVAAFSLPSGTSMMEWMGGDFPPNWIHSAAGNSVKVGNPEETIFTGVDKDITAEAIKRLNWQGKAAFTEQLGRPGRHVRITYLVATQDVALPPAVQEEWTQAADFCVTVPSGHSPHLSHPAVVADIIATAIARHEEHPAA